MIRNTVVLKKGGIFFTSYCPLILTPDTDRSIESEAIVGKLRKLLDCGNVRRNMRAVVIYEAHLVVEWQVYLISVSSYFTLLQFNKPIWICK